MVLTCNCSKHAGTDILFRLSDAVLMSTLQSKSTSRGNDTETDQKQAKMVKSNPNLIADQIEWCLQTQSMS